MFFFQNNLFFTHRFLENILGFLKLKSAEYLQISVHNSFFSFDFATCLGKISFLPFFLIGYSSIRSRKNNVCMQYCCCWFSLLIGILFDFLVSAFALIVDNKVEFWQKFCPAHLSQCLLFCDHEILETFMIC